MEKLKIDPKKSYQKRYRMRSIGGGFVATVPKILVDRKARELEISLKDFIKNYCVVVMFDDFDKVEGMFTFEKIRKVEETKR